jgi:hypothetical protein
VPLESELRPQRCRPASRLSDDSTIMLHAPTSETKQRSSQSKAQEPQPEHQLHPRLGVTATQGWSSGAGSESALMPGRARGLDRWAGLHRTYGNQAVLKSLQSGLTPGAAGGSPQRLAVVQNQGVFPRLQTKLTIDTPGDQYEQEADRLAEQVMSMPDPSAAAVLRVPEAVSSVQRKCAACEDEEKSHVQRKESSNSELTSTPPIVSQVFDSPGQPMDHLTKRFMEQRFGYGFDGVRVHTDDNAARSARAVNALAYTYGHDVVFGQGQYAPTSFAGSALLAHELTHVLQQSEPCEPPAPLRVNASSMNVADSANAAGANPPRMQLMTLRKPSVQRQANQPNLAPACEEICGDKGKCIVEQREVCPDALNNAVFNAWKDAADNLAKAITNFSLSSASLKSNFNWSSGNPPPGLPSLVLTTLNAALPLFGQNLCNKCRNCQGVVRIEKARGKDCVDGSNCFVICSDFQGAPNKAHSLLHEVFHRVVPLGQLGDVYRGDPKYTGPPSMSLKFPDAYASLVDDLVAATPASTPAPSGTPSSPPAAPPPSARP